MVYPSQINQKAKKYSKDNAYKYQSNGVLDEKKTLNQTVSEFMKDWLLIKRSSIRLKTAQDYNRLINKYILPTFKEISLSDLKTIQLNNFYRDLLKEGVGARTVRYIHSILRVALKNAVGQGLIASNPTDCAILPRWQKKEMHILDEEQISKFLMTAKQSPYYGIYHFAIVTGMRKGELLGLKWFDVDWSKETLFIRRQAQRVNGHGIVFEEPKTRAGIRKIKIQQNSIQELHNQKKRMDILKERAGDRWEEHDLVFSTRKGTPVVSSNLRRNFNQMLERAKIPRIRFHDLRHTAATMMINHGVPITVVSQILGHSKPSVTLDIYSHCSVAMQTQASFIMDEIVKI